MVGQVIQSPFYWGHYESGKDTYDVVDTIFDYLSVRQTETPKNCQAEFLK
jgi:hypothetical protein